MSLMPRPFSHAIVMMFPADVAVAAARCRATVAKSTEPKLRCDTPANGAGRKAGEYIFTREEASRAVAALRVTVRGLPAPGGDPPVTGVPGANIFVRTRPQKGNRQYYGTSLGGV